MTIQRIPEHPKWDAFKTNFMQSNYITDFWNWLLTLLSKSAELVLFGSILYSSYQLIPGVPMVPAGIDAFLFLVQQAALDIGGMGLLKLAKRAGLPRNSFPMQVGVTLVVLMILNVVLATVKHALPMVPGLVFVIAEAFLLIVRAIMAVLFGHAIHALREEYGDSLITIKDARELETRVDELASELAHVRESMSRHLEQQINALSARETMMLNAMKQEVETTVASLTPECLMHRLTGHIEMMLQERLTVSLEAMRQNNVSSVSNEDISPVSSEISNLRLFPSHHVSSKGNKRRETSGETTHQARVYALLDEDRSRKPADIVRLTGIPKATVYRLVERYHGEYSVIEVRQNHETVS